MKTIADRPELVARRRRLNQRRTGVNRQRPIVIYSEATTVCNSKCSFCPIAKVNDVRGREYIRPEVEDRMIDFVQAFPDLKFTTFFHVVGEPLLYKKLEQYLARMTMPQNNVWVASNGALLTPERLNSLFEAGLRNVWFSLFGATPEEYNEITKTKNFARARKNLDNLLDHSDALERINIISFSERVDDPLRDAVSKRRNVTLREDRVALDWEPGVGDLVRSICVSVDGKLSYDWRDYNFLGSNGNVLEMTNDEIMDGYLAAEEAPLVQS